MMDWNRIRQQWHAGPDQAPPGDILAAVQERDRKVRSTIRRRDWGETAAAVLVAPLFAYWAWQAGARGAWGAAFFCGFIVLWSGYVPFQLWRARRRLPMPRHDLPLVEYLRQERAALLAQARMLERVWLWYLGPCAFGVIGLSMSYQGVSAASLTYSAFVLVFCAVVARLNFKVARTRFRALAAQIEQQISRLTEENRQ